MWPRSSESESVSVDYLKDNGHRQNDKETSWDLASSRTTWVTRVWEPFANLKSRSRAYWKDRELEVDLHRTASDLRRIHWLQQKEAGIDLIPSNDFSLYDHVLDTSAMVGAVPERFGWNGSRIDLPTYFAMARGKTTGYEEAGDDASGAKHAGVHAMEMTKWFDTNYHYIVPEFYEGQKFSFASAKAVDEFREALSFGIKT